MQYKLPSAAVNGEAAETKSMAIYAIFHRLRRNIADYKREVFSGRERCPDIETTSLQDPVARLLFSQFPRVLQDFLIHTVE